MYLFVCLCLCFTMLIFKATIPLLMLKTLLLIGHFIMTIVWIRISAIDYYSLNNVHPEGVSIITLCLWNALEHYSYQDKWIHLSVLCLNILVKYIIALIHAICIDSFTFISTRMYEWNIFSINIFVEFTYITLI